MEMGLDASQMHEESDMAQSFKVGDSFIFNGEPSDWWKQREGLKDHPWLKIKKGSLLTITYVHTESNSYVANGLHFYLNQMDLPFRIKLRRKSA